MADRPDPVDALIRQWERERPDIDFAPMSTIGRMGRVMLHITSSIEGVFAGHGLTVGDFDVLATLRRSGEPYTVTPTELARLLMLSPAGVTSRLDRLEAAGFLERSPDPDDRRSWLVRLTDTGRSTVDTAVAEHVANESRLLEPLSASQRSALDRALRVLLTQFE